MTVYQLTYIYENNGESGACRSYNIAQTTNKEIIEKIIRDNNLTTVDHLERGQSHVFLFNYFEPNFPEYVNDDMLKYALEEDKEYKEEQARVDELMSTFHWRTR